MHEIKIPLGAKMILDSLHNEGYDAYVVGGCVRDSLLGIEPHDWDICTSATPQEVIDILTDYEVIPTGIKHGTVTAISTGMLSLSDGYEITTFRCDGDYYDNRHPSSVEFVRDLREDLSRRDFTINAIAYSEETGVIDYNNGLYDLDNGVVACVGNPDDRFAEDALRIMRAMRFASTYGFSIDSVTAEAIHKNKDRLNNIAVERVQSELLKILKGKGALDILLDYSDVIATIIPELKPCIGFEQNNRYHQYTVYEHIAHAVSNYDGNDSSVKLALLLHDIGKPECYTEDENGGHFHGHGIISHDIAERVVERLKLDIKTRAEVLELVLYHDSVIEPTPKTVRRWLNRIGEEQFRRLLQLRMADIKAHAFGTQESRIMKCDMLSEITATVLKEAQCFSLKDLEIDGCDVMSITHLPEGKMIGNILKEILDDVISGSIENTRSTLVDRLVKCYCLNQS